MDKEYEVAEFEDDDEVNRLDSWLAPVINSFMTYKGQMETMADLPKTDNKLGDVYYIISEESQYAYNGMTWELIDDTHGDGGGSSFVNYKGIKDTVSDLPSDGNEVGDTWYVSEDSSMYLWNGTSWDSLGEVAPPATSVEWDDITGKPDVFYVHPASPAGANPKGLYEVATDEDGHIIEVGTVSEVHVDDIADVASADGRLVPNVNTMKSYVESATDGIDDAVFAANMAVESANQATTVANEAMDATKGLTKISGGYGPPAVGGNTGDMYIDYNTGDIYEFGNDETA